MSISKELIWGIKLNQTCLMFTMWLFLASGETVEYTNNSNLGKFWLLNDGEAWVDLEEALDLDHLKVIYFSKIQTSSNLNVAWRLWHWIETFCLRLVSLVDDVRSYITKSVLSPFKLRNWCGVSRMANILITSRTKKCKWQKMLTSERLELLHNCGLKKSLNTEM